MTLLRFPLPLVETTIHSPLVVDDTAVEPDSRAFLRHFATQTPPSALHDMAAGVTASKETVHHLLTIRDLRDAGDFLLLSLF